MAPNLITFSGFMLTVLNFFIIAYYDWDFTAANTILIAPSRIPNWVWMLVAINIFLAYTLGKSSYFLVK
jgi:ethanolaminephosphotransferase